MLEFGRDLLVRGIGAAKAKSWDEARFFFEKLLRMEAPVEMRVEAWRYLAEMSADAAEKRDYVGRILSVDPTDGFARRMLAVLDGRLNPADIIDPDLPPPVDERLEMPGTANTERLGCPKCGSGLLVASSDGQRLVCSHCQYEEPIGVDPSAAPADHDFAATIWTKKGHRSSAPTLTYICDGCGASFLVPSGIHSQACPFCGSTYIDSNIAPRELIMPDAILPFETVADLPSGAFAVYLPAWLFKFMGSVQWTGYVREREGFESQRRPASGDFTVIEQKAIVCATPALPESLEHLVDGFNLSPLIPYDPRQLAGCFAATYQISLDEASILARAKAVAALRVAVKEDQPEVFDMETTFGRIDIDSYQLLLLPFWTAQAGVADSQRLIVNGQTGAFGRNVREPGMLSWLGRLIGLPPRDTP